MMPKTNEIPTVTEFKEDDYIILCDPKAPYLVDKYKKISLENFLKHIRKDIENLYRRTANNVLLGGVVL